MLAYLILSLRSENYLFFLSSVETVLYVVEQYVRLEF